MSTKYNHSLSSPLIAVTSGLACVAWIILFIGSCVAAFDNVTWFIVIYQLAVVIGIIALLALDKFETFHNMAYLFLAVSILYLTAVCQLTVESNYIGGARAATAGSVILVIVEFIWAFELTAPGGGTKLSNGDWEGTKSKARVFGNKFAAAVRRPNESTSDDKPLPSFGDDESVLTEKESHNTIFEQVVATHAYPGNPDDPNELSFEKDEVLEILDKNGEWWKARKQNGTIGIVPSNYFN